MVVSTDDFIYTPPSPGVYDEYSMPGFRNKANLFMATLARVAHYMYRQNQLERAQANNTEFIGFYGADDVAANYQEKTYSRSSPLTYPRVASTTIYNRRAVATKFYESLVIITKGFYGYSLDFLHPDSISLYFSDPNAYNNWLLGQSSNSNYPAHGLYFSSFWKNPRGTVQPYAGETANGVRCRIASNIYYGDWVWKNSTTGSSSREKAVKDFLNTITLFVARDHLMSKLGDCLPLAQLGNGASSDGWDFDSSKDFVGTTYPERAVKFFSLKPTAICQIRQVLAAVMSNPKYGTDEWRPWVYAGQVQCSIAVQDGLSERGIINAIIPDKTIDPSRSSVYGNPVSDPLVVAGTGYGLIADTDGDLAHLAPVVSLRRRYMFKPYCSYYDYPEPDNPNAFEKKYGRVRYGQSNLHQWLNSTTTSAGGWAVKAHDADAFASTATYTYGYLNHISPTLRTNLAKIEYTYPSGNADAIINNTCAVAFTDDWVAIPNMTQFGYSNAVSTRKTARIAVDDTTHGEFYFQGEYGEIEYGNSSYCAEDNWRPAMSSHSYHKFAYNPNFATPTASTARRCPSRTPANSSSDSYDATISNLVAAMDSNDNGSTAPAKTTSQPWFVEDGVMVYFTIAAFHADKIDPSLPAENIHGAKLSS